MGTQLTGNFLYPKRVQVYVVRGEISYFSSSMCIITFAGTCTHNPYTLLYADANQILFLFVYTPANENSSSFCSGLFFPFDSNKRQRLGTANDQKREVLAFLDSYSKVFGQHMPHVEATHLYLGCKKVTWTLI